MTPDQNAPTGEEARVDETAAAAPGAPSSSSGSDEPKVASFPGSALFREEAVNAYLRGDRESNVLRAAPPWTSTILVVAASLVTTALVIAVVGRVEITSRGRGVLRARGNALTLAAPSAGLVDDVRASSDDVVNAGDVVLTMHRIDRKASGLDAVRRVAAIEASMEAVERRRSEPHPTRRALLTKRVALLELRIDSEKKSAVRLEGKAPRPAASAPADQRVELETVKNQELLLEDELLTTKNQLANLDSEIDAELRDPANEALEARVKHAAIPGAQERIEVIAPRAGRLEATPLRVGDSLTAGATIGKLIPLDLPTRVVSFIPERDRAFLAEGAAARIEIDQLPVSEFGAFQGRITRIGSDLASAEEIREALGDQAQLTGPLVRVEVALDDDAHSRRMAHHLHSNSLLSVRYTLRQRRLITLFVEPLRRWLN